MEKISLKEQWKIWSEVAIHSFGGPAGQIAVIHRLVVDKKKLLSEERFLHALNFCMLLPGPEAQQLATYMGWLMNGWRGGLLAGGLFILPGFLSILILSFLYILFREQTLVQGIFYGIKPAIIAIVLAALWRISKKSLKKKFHWLMAILAFVSLFFFKISFPLVVIGAGVLGVVYGKVIFSETLEEELPELIRPSTKSSLKTFLVWFVVWMIPIILTIVFLGTDSTLHKMNIFFSQMSLVTFGGAYAALTYVAQQAVEVYHWLLPGEMMDGLAFAETTPGPLIQSVQFVGFMGAYRFPDIASPLGAAVWGSILSTWMTFAPCFLWIFTFAPYVEFLRGVKFLRDALGAITASVVGVIFNLSLWFTLNTLYQGNQIDLWALGICLVALSLQFVFKKGLFTLLTVAVILGIVRQNIAVLF